MSAIPGWSMYREESGSGHPLFYLHGMTEWIGYSEEFTALLATRFRVVQAERRGHGRTPDVDGPITYDGMTQETAALMDELAAGPAHVVGFSDGGIVALLLAISRPDLVVRVVAIGPNVRVDGLTDAALAEIREATAETWPPEYTEAYGRLSPDGPEHWPIVFRKIQKMVLREPDLSAEDLRKIAAPTLLVGGDRDMVRLEHFLEMHEAIQGSQLCILPGASHEITVEEPRLAFEITARFLEGAA